MFVTAVVSSREVYENLVAEGVIIPKPEEAPPTVPMDFNWARVRF